ncbi:MAG: extracellular solute-binding protein [Chloroflexota bacterium]
MRNYHHLRLWLCLFVLAGVLSACTPNQPTPVAEEAPPVTVMPPLLTPAPTNGVTTITFGAQGWHQERFAPYIRQFNDINPDIKVEFVSLDDIAPITSPEEEALATVEAVDTAQPVRVGLWERMHPYYRDLRPLMEADANFDPSDFHPSSLEDATVDGGIYVLPHTRFVPLLSYNKELFAAQGIPEPTADWTWQDLRAAAEQLAQREDNEVTTYGLLGDVSGSGTTAVIGELMTIDPTLATTPVSQAEIDVDIAVQAIEQVLNLAETGAVYVRSDEGETNRTYIGLVNAGKIGMWPTGLLNDPLDQPAFEVGTIPFPDIPILLYSIIDGYVMSPGTQHPEAAWRWLSFLSQQSVPLELFSESFYTVPARISVTEESDRWQRFDALTIETIQADLSEPLVPYSVAATRTADWLVTGGGLRRVLNGEQTALVAAQEAQTELEAFKLAEQAQPDVDVDTLVVEAPVADTAPADASTITFASNVVNLQPLVDQFHQEQAEVFVQLEAVNNPTLTDLANTTDCFATWAPPTSAQQAALLDLRPLWDADTTLSRDVFPSAVLAPFEQDGALYGLPHRVDIPTLHYNPALFDAANLTYPTADWSLDDFVASATQLTQERDDLYGFAVVGDHTTALEWWLQREGVLQDTGELTWTDPDVLAALQGYVDLLTSTSPHKQLVGYTSTSPPDLTTQLVTGEQVAMWLDGRLTFGDTHYLGDGETIQVPLPGGTIENRAEDVEVTTGLYIAADTPHADACWQWLRYVSDNVTGIIGGMPARTDDVITERFAQDAEPGQSEVHAVYREALARATNREVQTFFLHDPNLDPFWFYRALDQALQGANLEQELTNAQQLTEAYLACVDAGGVGGDCAVETDPDYDGWQQTISGDE